MIDKTIRLEVYIQPNAGRSQVSSFSAGVLKVRIAAPPIEGKANQKLIEFLSEVLDIAKSNLIIIRGQTGKHKLIEITGLSEEQINNRIERSI
jgi:uncharacterized protein